MNGLPTDQEIRSEQDPVRVGATGRRLAEAARQGYRVALVPEDAGPAPTGMRSIEVPDLGAALTWIG